VAGAPPLLRRSVGLPHARLPGITAATGLHICLQPSAGQLRVTPTAQMPALHCNTGSVCSCSADENLISNELKAFATQGTTYLGSVDAA
jgi:hypothetical protein